MRFAIGKRGRLPFEFDEGGFGTNARGLEHAAEPNHGESRDQE